MKKNKVGYLAFAVSFSVAIVGCDSGPDEPINGGIKTVKVPQEATTVMNKIDAYYVDFMSKLCVSEKQDKNFIVSPFNAMVSVGLLANACNAAALPEFMNSMGLGASDLSGYNSLMGCMIRDLPLLDDNVNVNAATSIWMNKDVSLNSAYKSLVGVTYRCQSEFIDFSSPSALNAINDWFKKELNGVYKWDKLDPELRVLLISAMDLDIPWKEKFDPEKTIKRKFTNYDGSETDVDMMNGEFKGLYYSDDRYTWFRTDMGALGSFSMVLVMAAEGINLNSVIDDATVFGQPDDPTKLRCVSCRHFGLPKIDFEYSTDLSDIISVMKIPEVSSGQVFNGIFLGNIGEIKMKQDNRCIFNENGAQVVSVTYTGMDGAPLPDYIDELIFDRPFAYVIKENSTGAVLAFGRIMNLKPSKQ